MSNRFRRSSENERTARWRMRFPKEIFDAIVSLSIAEGRDPGAVVARWVKELYGIKYSTGKEGSGG